MTARSPTSGPSGEVVSPQVSGSASTPPDDDSTAAYVAALEAECAQANTLIGLLRYATRDSRTCAGWSSATYGPYEEYQRLRERRAEAASNGARIVPPEVKP